MHQLHHDYFWSHFISSPFYKNSKRWGQLEPLKMAETYCLNMLFWICFLWNDRLSWPTAHWRATQLFFTSIQLSLKTNDLYPEIEVSQYSVARDFTTRKWIRLSINPIITLGCHRCGKECPLWFYTFRPLKGWQLCISCARLNSIPECSRNTFIIIMTHNTPSCPTYGSKKCQKFPKKIVISWTKGVV